MVARAVQDGYLTKVGQQDLPSCFGNNWYFFSAKGPGRNKKLEARSTR
jgi:hypothetical protein